jgi:bla regulator protein BlaR1
LTGFWIESSLKISPREQTEVMERIFGEDSLCSEETRGENVYFCVRLGKNDGREVSSALAKETAIRIVMDEYKEQ